MEPIKNKESYTDRFYNKEFENFINTEEWNFLDFQILNKIETGSTGIVLKANHKLSKKTYALKKICVYNSGYSYNTILKIIESEIKIGKLNISKYINPIYGWFKNNKTEDFNPMYEEYYIISKSCDSDLFNFRNNIPLNCTFKKILKIIKCMITAVADLHSAGYMHLDIKLENFIIDYDTYDTYLIDFGFTQPFAEMDIFLGSLQYAAPELKEYSTEINRFKRYKKNLSKWDYRVDYYSLGVSIYALLYNSFFNSEKYNISLPQTFADFKESEYSEYTDSLKSILTCLLQSNPEKRVSAATLLKEQIFQNLE
jgi:serine/threonine protein kinase